MFLREKPGMQRSCATMKKRARVRTFCAALRRERLRRVTHGCRNFIAAGERDAVATPTRANFEGIGRLTYGT